LPRLAPSNPWIQKGDGIASLSSSYHSPCHDSDLVLRFGGEGADASTRGLPCGFQDRIQQRQKAFSIAQQGRRLSENWPFLATLLLVLPLVVIA
jgi:hypothetical protein